MRNSRMYFHLIHVRQSFMLVTAFRKMLLFFSSRSLGNSLAIFFCSSLSLSIFGARSG